MPNTTTSIKTAIKQNRVHSDTVTH